MTVPEKAVAWALQIAADDSHGYDQGSRWGPDYDCSSLVISAYKHAGVPLTCTYTGNMRANMLDNGFVQVNDVNLATGAGLQPGDVLLNVVHHTAMAVGDGMIVHASGNEHGGATGGKTGDQTGREISKTRYFNFSPGGWDYVLRYARKDPEPTPEPEPDPDPQVVWYTVRDGDTLWGIAEMFLGTGLRYPEIQAWNGLTSTLIYPGQRLKIPTDAPSPAPTPDPTEGWVKVTLPVLREGDSSLAVQSAQYLLKAKGYDCSDCDGEMGPYTTAAVRFFQEDHGIAVGPVDAKTWYALIRGD